MTATIAYTNAMRAGNPHTARDIAKRELGAATKCLQHYIWRIRMDKASDALADRLQSGQLPGHMTEHVSNGEFDPDTKPLVL